MTFSPWGCRTTAPPHPRSTAPDNRLHHVWFVNTIWFHVSMIILQLFRIHCDLLYHGKEKRIGTFQNRSRLYYCIPQAETKNVVSMTSWPFAKYSERSQVIGKNSRFWYLNTYNFITGQNFSKISSVV